jgi:basic amino acid/polyamine antiporter, APA family
MLLASTRRSSTSDKGFPEMDKTAQPGSTLSTIDAVVIVIGIVVGAGIFKTPAIVAANSASQSVFLFAWVMGGVASLIGALCYAELASTYPNAGGDYHFLRRAFGRSPGFLFAWSRMTVIQAGSIAMLAFLLGDYLTEVVSLGRYSNSVYAGLVIVLLTGANIAGIRQGSLMQRILTGAILVGLCVIVVMGLATDPTTSVPAREGMSAQAAFGSSMIFVLLTYGGWNEAAYLSGELKEPRRNMLRVLLYSIGAITLLYLIVNFALLRSLGFVGMSGSEVVAADVMRKALGEPGAKFISFLIGLTALSTMNGTIITGARTNYALGRDFRTLSFLGRWQGRRGTPVNALVAQGVIALLLVVFGTESKSGFVAMVEYTAPVFWFFLLLVVFALFRLRSKDPHANRPFRVPLYPFLPLVFCVICAFMLVSSVLYTGRGALVGIAVMAVGLPLLLLNRESSPTGNLVESKR